MCIDIAGKVGDKKSTRISAYEDLRCPFRAALLAMINTVRPSGGSGRSTIAPTCRKQGVCRRNDRKSSEVSECSLKVNRQVREMKDFLSLQTPHTPSDSTSFHPMWQAFAADQLSGTSTLIRGAWAIPQSDQEDFDLAR